uniref:Putative capsid protein n=1 Tax=viral metagenome TaxID=1070528 RepID=A0A6M3J244_9ZZZZ
MGNSLTYDLVTTRSGAKFYGVGATWTESTPILTQDTAVLRILGGDADIDNFIRTTRSNILDVKGQVLNDKVKSVKEKYLDTFYYGATASVPEEFNGLQTLMTSTTYNTVHAGAGTGTALSILKLQEAIDIIEGWEPSHIVMSKQMRRYINVYLDSIGDKFTTVRDNYGKIIAYFRGLQVVTSDHIVNVETAASGAYSAKTGGANTTIFILSFDAKACAGIQGESGIETISLGDLETKDAQRTRIRWYCGMKLEDLRSCAKVDGIVAAGTVTA